LAHMAQVLKHDVFDVFHGSSLLWLLPVAIGSADEAHRRSTATGECT
jgi:hypothetical protein